MTAAAYQPQYQPTPSQHQHPRGWMPGKTPKDPWGYYAPEYDPDADPWETDSDKEARRQQHNTICQPAQPQPQQTVWPAQTPTTGDTQQMTASPVGYTVPPGANRWGYTLTYHPPTAGHAAYGTAAQGLPHTVAALPPVPEQQSCHSSGGPQHHSHEPAAAATSGHAATGQATARTASSPPMPEGDTQHPHPHCHRPAAQSQRNRWGRTLQQIPESTGTQTATSQANPPTDTEPQQGAPASSTDAHPPSTEHHQEKPATKTGHARMGQATTQQQPAATAGPDTTARQDATAEATTQGATQPRHNTPPSGETHPTPDTAQGGQQQAEQAGGATLHSSATTHAQAATGNWGEQGGGQPQQPPPELEEVPTEENSRQQGGASQQRPYHEGRGDQRMRGKRFKSAVQAAFQQRGWSKDDDETWKGVAHLVGMDEEEDEESWAQILAKGPPPGESRVRPDRRPKGGQQGQTQTRGTQGGPASQPDWSAVLNLHTKPRGSVTPEQLQELQKPSRPQPAQHDTAAAGDPAGTPRRRQPASSHTAKQQPQRRQTTATGGPAGEPRRRQADSSSTTQQQPEEDEEEPFLWDGLFSTMTLSAGGASRPVTFPPEIPTAWGVDIHFRYLGYGAWAGVTMATGSRRAPEYRNAKRGILQSHAATTTRGSGAHWLYEY